MGPNLTTATPWIAFVSCEYNESMASQEWDIFTLARDRGAVSALLYSTYSESCLLNPEYIDDFEKPLDVFATTARSDALLINNQFQHAAADMFYYNGTLLNETGASVNSTLAGNYTPTQTYLVGTLAAQNGSFAQATQTYAPPTGSPPNSGSPPVSRTSGMIALYAIAGLVILFLISMFFVGCMRARRNPERYGRRDSSDEHGAQTTAGGLAQAILDTFPIITFHRGVDRSTEHHPTAATGGAAKKRLSSDDSSSQWPSSIVLPELRQAGIEQPHQAPGASRNSMAAASARSPLRPSSSFVSEGHETDAISTKSVEPYGVASGSASGSGSRRTSALEYRPSPSVYGPGEEVDQPEDHCPICLLEFETGDDLRILPCEREHVYHQSCIDPWYVSLRGPVLQADPSQAAQSLFPLSSMSQRPVLHLVRDAKADSR